MDYDENYYEGHFCGVAYTRNEPHWSRFFGNVADQIVKNLNARTVFDAGCAIGFLVEELRKRHVEAFGRDFSEYAIEKVPETLKPFCEVGSIVDPIEGTYDLVTCIEVIEHMTEADGRLAIANLCTVAPLILFSSSPDAFDEPTHINVQPPLYWLRIFREFGFAPRAAHDPSYLCSWAMLLERRETKATDEELEAYAFIVQMRMEHLKQLQEQHSHLGDVRADYERRLDALRHEGDVQIRAVKLQYETEAKSYRHAVEIEKAEKDAVIVDLNARASSSLSTLNAMRASTSWRITAPYRKVGHQALRARYVARVLPKMARSRGGYVQLAKAAIRTFSEGGLRGCAKAWKRANAPSIPEGVILPSSDYGTWLKAYAVLEDGARRRIKNEIARWNTPPLISIVIPVYNPDLPWLGDAIESVRNQLYTNWEICLADDCSTNPGVREYLDAYAARDKRIKVAHRDVNGHISEASNSALALASGQWMALLDQDDLLTEDALYYIARAIIKNRNLELIYSDEDKIEDGKRFLPYFKSDWNLELMRTHNMVCHLGAYKMDRVRSIGGFRKGFEGSQDYDLVLRFAENLESHQICHIPRVLYHWRSHANSTAQAAGNKSYAVTAGQKALTEHLERRGVEGHVEILDTAMYRVHYTLSENPPLVSLIIPTRNGLHLLRQCISSIIEKTTYPAYEIIIVDNNSDDPEVLDYFRDVQADPRVRVVRDEAPFNYSALNNRAAEIAGGEYLGLINNDIEVISPNWLSEMIGLAVQERVGAVGARLWYPDNRLQHGGIIIGLGGVAGHSHKMLERGAPGYFRRAELPQDLSAVTAACLVVRKDIFKEVGGLNEVDLTIAFNDVDFCLKVQKAGYRNVWTPYAELYHHESASRGVEDTPEKIERFGKEVGYMFGQWNTRLSPDPAYNTNLSTDYEDFSLAWPPRNSDDPTLAS